MPARPGPPYTRGMNDWRSAAREHHPIWDDDDRAEALSDTAALDRLGVRHSPQPAWDRGPYQPLEAYGRPLPSLVLALPRHTLPERLPPGGRDWIAVEHHSQGFTCFHDDLVLTVLRPRPGVQEAMERLSDLYLGGNLEHPTIDQLVEYRERLRELLGVECPPHHTWFQEACYPIDLAGLAKLTDEELDVPEGAELFVLGPNGDTGPPEEAERENPDATVVGRETEVEDLDAAVVGRVDAAAVRQGSEAEPYQPLAAYGLVAPVLVLADIGGRLDPLPKERDWLAVRHGDWDLVLTPLEPAAEAGPGLLRLAGEYADLVADPPTLDELVAYRDRLRELVGAACTDGSAPLGGGLCPIDLAELPRLTGHDVQAPAGGRTWELLLLV